METTVHSDIDGVDLQLSEWFANQLVLELPRSEWLWSELSVFYTKKDKKKKKKQITWLRNKKNPSLVFQDTVWKHAHHVGH